jgi:hypothetical protein
MKPLTILISSLTLLLLTLITVAGQSATPALAPFLINLHHQLPTTVTLTDADGITTTVPLTLTLDLQITVAGPHSTTVTTADPITPTITLTPIQPSVTLTDALGYPYQIITLDDNLALTEWTVYQDSNNYPSFAGELRNTSTDQRLSLAELVLRLYRVDDTLLAVETITASGRWVDPDQTLRFSGFTYADPEQLHHYTLEITGQDWQPLP